MPTEKNTITFEPTRKDELSSFLEANKDKYHEFWIILTKKKEANPQPVSFSEVVDEAIKHGLIDSRTKSVNDEKYGVRLTKRRNPDKR